MGDTAGVRESSAPSVSVSRASEALRIDPPTVAVAMACFNRRETTRACLETLSTQAGAGSEFLLRIHVLDDGSTDGTSEMVRDQYPDVHLIVGTGELYWAAGMHVALTTASRDRPEFFLWLNDDVELDQDAVRKCLAASRSAEPHSIIVGATRWHERNEVSYGGLRRYKSRQPTALTMVAPQANSLTRVDTFHGNVVLVPAAVMDSLGPVDARFRHSLGDVDYGLRALKKGFHSYIAPGFIGRCDARERQSEWENISRPRRERLRLLLEPKGWPIGPHFRYITRHSGALGVVWFIASYWKPLKSILGNAAPSGSAAR